MLSMIAQARLALGEFARQAEIICQSYCPVRTGFMHNSIYVDMNVPAQRKEIVARITVGAYYASYVEYGTSRQQAQPFVRPTIEWARANMVNFVQEYGFGTKSAMTMPQGFQDTM